MSAFRTVTSGIVQWRGFVIGVILECRPWVDHLQLRTIDPPGAPLPVTPSGQFSSFVPKHMIEATDPELGVQRWLDKAATGRRWIEQETLARQYALF